ncbi:Uncharacterised protein [Shigella sonnei]|nr:Uncharacterised protein [Shigella sonnei]CST33013.1 Uncharacterised protein [Shigella sonnei]
MPVSIKKGMITTIATSNGLSRGNLYRAASLRAAKKTINVSGNDHQIFAIILLILSDLRLYVHRVPVVNSSSPPEKPPAY